MRKSGLRVLNLGLLMIVIGVLLGVFLPVNALTGGLFGGLFAALSFMSHGKNLGYLAAMAMPLGYMASVVALNFNILGGYGLLLIAYSTVVIAASIQHHWDKTGNRNKDNPLF